MSNTYHNDEGTPPVEMPWRQSKRGAIYCMSSDLSDELKSQLKEQDGFQTIIGEFHYYVLKTEEGGFLVFRNPKPEHEPKRYLNKKVQNSLTELKVVSVEEANLLLGSSDEYLLIGDDPVKVVNGQFFAVLGKRH